MTTDPPVADPHQINRSLLTLLDNQVARREAAFEDLDETTYGAQPGHDCNSIQGIARHLVLLRRFQMTLLESPLADEVVIPAKDEPMADLLANLIGVTTGFIFAILLSAGWCRRIEMYMGYHD